MDKQLEKLEIYLNKFFEVVPGYSLPKAEILNIVYKIKEINKQSSKQSNE